MAAATFFTFGAALGLSGTLGGGWGAAVSGAMAKVGLTGTFANIVGGAIAQAGYGALAGGAIGAITGKGFVKGAQGGALMGAITGGALGAAGIGPGLAPKPGAANVNVSHMQNLSPPSMPSGAIPLGPPSPAGLGAAPGLLGTIKGGIESGSSFVKDNQALFGPLFTGVGRSIQGDPRGQGQSERDDRIQDSYDVDFSRF